ncbi:MAG: OmpA family protein [Candidatus Eisenbacteria bacterium]
MDRRRLVPSSCLLFSLLLASTASAIAAVPDSLILGVEFIEEGREAPAYVPLKVVYEHRWGLSGSTPPDWPLLYESIAKQARGAGADLVVDVVSGAEDPLIENGYARWILGVAARRGADSQEWCDNCVVDWIPVDSSVAGVGDPESFAILEKNAFLVSRLRLGERGYYLRARPEDSALEVPEDGLDADSMRAANLALEMRVSRGAAAGRAALEEFISFEASLIWKASGGEAWERTLAMTTTSAGADYVSGGDARSTLSTLADLFGGLRTRGPTPDSDGDQVPDSRDREFDTPEGARVNWLGIALDDDGDGVPDGIDRHPNTPIGVMVDQWGVPVDGDHDGVADYVDDCPETPADFAVDDQGCPKVEWVTVLEDVLVEEGVLRERFHFDFGRADLKDDAKARLDLIGEALSGLPDLRFSVEGHCDDRGSETFNLALSERRAKASIDYLLANFEGLSIEQFIFRGLGKSVPLVEGTDEHSRFLNRRVEFVVLNPEEARRQVEIKRIKRRGGADWSSPDSGAAPR